VGEDIPAAAAGVHACSAEFRRDQDPGIPCVAVACWTDPHPPTRTSAASRCAGRGDTAAAAAGEQADLTQGLNKTVAHPNLLPADRRRVTVATAEQVRLSAVGAPDAFFAQFFQLQAWNAGEFASVVGDQNPSSRVRAPRAKGRCCQWSHHPLQSGANLAVVLAGCLWQGARGNQRFELLDGAIARSRDWLFSAPKRNSPT